MSVCVKTMLCIITRVLHRGRVFRMSPPSGRPPNADLPQTQIWPKRRFAPNADLPQTQICPNLWRCGKLNKGSVLEAGLFAGVYVRGDIFIIIFFTYLSTFSTRCARERAGQGARRSRLGLLQRSTRNGRMLSGRQQGAIHMRSYANLQPTNDSRCTRTTVKINHFRIRLSVGSRCNT